MIASVLGRVVELRRSVDCITDMNAGPRLERDGSVLSYT